MSSFPLVDSTELAAKVTEPGVVLLDFWQEACAPCRALEPRLERFARSHHGAFHGYRIDVDTQSDAVARYNVMTIPTLVVLENGREVHRLDGLIRDDDLAAIIGPVTRG